MQIGRMIALMALGIDTPGLVINRYCGSGVEAIAMAAARDSRGGKADVIHRRRNRVDVASLPVDGEFKTALNLYGSRRNHPTYYHSMGLTAEEISKHTKISRGRPGSVFI